MRLAHAVGQQHRNTSTLEICLCGWHRSIVVAETERVSYRCLASHILDELADGWVGSCYRRSLWNSLHSLLVSLSRVSLLLLCSCASMLLMLPLILVVAFPPVVRPVAVCRPRTVSVTTLSPRTIWPRSPLVTDPSPKVSRVMPPTSLSRMTRLWNHMVSTLVRSK